MSKLVERKWKVASCVGFTVALAFELIAKKIAADDMLSMTKNAAGAPIEQHGWAAGHIFPWNGSAVGMFAAVVAAACWRISAHRHEPGSFLPLGILAVLYAFSFLTIV